MGNLLGQFISFVSPTTVQTNIYTFQIKLCKRFLLKIFIPPYKKKGVCLNISADDLNFFFNILLTQSINLDDFEKWQTISTKKYIYSRNRKVNYSNG